MSIKQKESQLIFIETAEYFDLHLQPKKRQQFELKFVILKDREDSQLKMLLMEICHYHPRPVLLYMQAGKLEGVITNGAGKVLFDMQNRTINFFGHSKSFDSFCPREVLAIAAAIWPEFKITFDVPDPAQEIAISGERFTIEEMSLLVEKI